MIWSAAWNEKFQVIISTIGRRPFIAMPIAAPVNPPSAIGVSMHALRPEPVEQPIGDQVGAAVDADVLAQEDDRLVALHLFRHRGAQRLAIGRYSASCVLRTSCQHQLADRL